MKFNWHALANPNRFMRFSGAVLPWVAGIAGIAFAAGIYLSFFASPPDYQQGETVRIMYIHVPAAWTALFAYVAMAVASAAALVWRHPLSHIAAKSAAPVGAAFTLIALATGMLWGKPMWGTFWEWDARLTSVLILFFLYLGYIALENAFDDPNRGAQAAAILAIVGVVMVPIIHFSVDWWATLHQGSIFKGASPVMTPAETAMKGGAAAAQNKQMFSVHSSMLWPLFTMAFAFKAYFAAVVLVRMRGEISARKLRALQIARSYGNS